MNNIFSSSWCCNSTNFNTDIQLSNSFPGHSINSSSSGSGDANLDRFFEDVESIKGELKEVESLHCSLHSSNKTLCTLHAAVAIHDLRSRMDTDVTEWSKEHPSGNLPLINLTGQDVTDVFIAFYLPAPFTNHLYCHPSSCTIHHNSPAIQHPPSNPEPKRSFSSVQHSVEYTESNTRAANEAWSVEAAIAGNDATLQALRELIIYPFLYSAESGHLDIKWPSVLLLHGPTGTRKTNLVHAHMWECDTHLITINPFSVHRVHTGESKKFLREAFSEAYSLALSWKSGHFDSKMKVTIPTARDRLKIPQLYMKDMYLCVDVDLHAISKIWC